MPFTVVIAAFAMAVSIPLLWVSVAGARTGRQSTLGDVTDARSLALEQGAGARVARPALAGLARRLRGLTPQSRIDSMRHSLALAGANGDFAVERMLVAKFGLTTAVVALALLLPWTDRPLLRIAVAVGAGVLSFYLPEVIVRSRAQTRQDEIRMELPDTLDQVRMSVDAGLGFEAAVARAARAGDGPLAMELSRMLREMQLGIPRDEALRNLGARTDVEDLDSFVIAVVQSQQYGIPIASVLRVQSDELRDKRKQRAEERALKIPVLLIFPLAFCIFPAMFIVLLGPAVIRIFRDLGPAIAP